MVSPYFFWVTSYFKGIGISRRKAHIGIDMPCSQLILILPITSWFAYWFIGNTYQYIGIWQISLHLGTFHPICDSKSGNSSHLNRILFTRMSISSESAFFIMFWANMTKIGSCKKNQLKSDGSNWVRKRGWKGGLNSSETDIGPYQYIGTIPSKGYVIILGNLWTHIYCQYIVHIVYCLLLIPALSNHWLRLVNKRCLLTGN